MIEQQALYRGRNVFIVDPWNEIIIPSRKNENRTDVSHTIRAELAG